VETVSSEEVIRISFEETGEGEQWKNKIREFAKKVRFVGVTVYYEDRVIYVAQGENLKWKIEHAKEKIRGIVEELENTILVASGSSYFYVEFAEKNFEKAIAIIESAISSKISGIYFLPNIIKDAVYLELEAMME
jgi:hypothetical protein